MSLVLLCLGVWLLFTASRGRVLSGLRHRPTVSGPLAASLLAGVGTLLLLGGLWGVACGAAVAVGARWLLRRLSRGESPRHQHVGRIAPEAVECIAACVAAGAPLWASMSSVADSFAGPMGDLLRRTASRHDLGASYEETFAELLDDPLLAPVGRILLRSVESGASLSTALTTCAQQMRQVRGSELENRARAIGVKAVAPLAVCFLPAFIVLAVVPIIGSLVAGLV